MTSLSGPAGCRGVKRRVGPAESVWVIDYFRRVGADGKSWGILVRSSAETHE
jgi:hypothetical protein